MTRSSDFQNIGNEFHLCWDGQQYDYPLHRIPAAVAHLKAIPNQFGMTIAPQFGDPPTGGSEGIQSSILEVASTAAWLHSSRTITSAANPGENR